jgi:hypothetical protein
MVHSVIGSPLCLSLAFLHLFCRLAGHRA